MLERILEKINNKSINIPQWITGFVGIVFIRFIFESLASRTNSSGILPSDTYTIMHMQLYFLTIALGLICIIGYFCRDYKSIGKIILFGLPIIWLGPIIDIVISGGGGVMISYIRDTGSNLIFDFFTFFGPDFSYGATYGLRIEMIIILFAIGYYVWIRRKNLVQSILVVLFSYLFIFVSFVIPGLLYTLSNIGSTTSTVPEVINYLTKLILSSNIYHNTFREGLLFVSLSRLVEMGFDKLFSQIFFLFSCIFSLLWFWKIEPLKLKAVLKNSRPERIIFFVGLSVVGMGYAYLFGYGNLGSWVDILSFICLALSIIGAWMYAVHLNDVADVVIDKISNINRPIIQKILAANEMRDIGYIWLLVAIVGSWSAGFYPFFMVLVYVSAAYIYSVPPLRLRIVPILSSFLISIACLATILSGFFFVSINKRIETFPIFLSIGILIIFTLIINIKDLKDIEGDKADDINTLPILFGKNGTLITGLCFAMGILLIPFFFSTYTLYITAIPTAIIGYKIILKKPFIEKKIFILGFLFFLSSIILLISLYSLAEMYNIL